MIGVLRRNRGDENQRAQSTAAVVRRQNGGVLHAHVVGVHGGAGASTVAALLRTAGLRVTEVDEHPSGPPAGAAAVLVVRESASGTHALAQGLAPWTDWFGQQPVLVTVPDLPTGRPPASAAYRLRALRDRYLGPARLPWSWLIREADTPEQVAEHRKVQAIAARLATQITTATTTATDAQLDTNPTKETDR